MSIIIRYHPHKSYNSVFYKLFYTKNTLVHKDSLWKSVKFSGERQYLKTVTFAELYCLPMTMLCAVEGVTRAGVVDAAGVAWKSASEMGHSG